MKPIDTLRKLQRTFNDRDILDGVMFRMMKAHKMKFSADENTVIGSFYRGLNTSSITETDIVEAIEKYDLTYDKVAKAITALAV